MRTFVFLALAVHCFGQYTPAGSVAPTGGGGGPTVSYLGQFINQSGVSSTITPVTVASGCAIAIFVQMPTGGLGTFPPTISDTGSNTYTAQTSAAQGASGYQTRWYMKVNAAALSAGTITVGPANNQFFGNSAAAYSVCTGSATSADASADTSNAPGSGTTGTTAAITTTTAAEAVLVGFGLNGAQLETAITSGWTVDYTNASAQFILAHQVFSSTQAGITVTATVGSSQNWTTGTVGLK